MLLSSPGLLSGSHLAMDFTIFSIYWERLVLSIDYGLFRVLIVWVAYMTLKLFIKPFYTFARGRGHRLMKNWARVMTNHWCLQFLCFTKNWSVKIIFLEPTLMKWIDKSACNNFFVPFTFLLVILIHWHPWWNCCRNINLILLIAVKLQKEWNYLIILSWCVVKKNLKIWSVDAL